jgi:hypothetical protein
MEVRCVFLEALYFLLGLTAQGYTNMHTHGFQTRGFIVPLGSAKLFSGFENKLP